MLRKKLFQHFLIYAMGSAVINGGGFLLIPLYTKYLTPVAYGIWGSVTILISLTAAVLGFGINGTITRFYYEFEDKQQWKVFFGLISKFVILLGLAVTVFIYFAGEPLLDSLFRSVRFEPYLKLGVIIGYLGVFPVIALALFQAKQQVLVYRSFTTLSFVLLTAGMLVFVVFLKRGALGALYAQLIAAGLMAALCLVVIIKEGESQMSWVYLRNAFTFGIPLMFYVIAGSATEMASRYFVERLTTLFDLGVFNLAQQYSSGLIMVVTAISMAWTPLFFEKAKEAESGIKFAKFGLYLTIIVCALALLMSLFAHEFVVFLASEQYDGAQKLVPWLLLSYVFGNGVWIAVVPPIVYRKQTHYLAWLTAVSGTVCITLNIFLIPVFGVQGAALAQLVSYMILAAMAYRVSHTLYPIDYPLGKIGLIFMLSIGLFYLSVAFRPDGIGGAVLYKTLLFSCFFLLLIVFRVFSTAEVREGVNFVRSLRFRKP